VNVDDVIVSTAGFAQSAAPSALPLLTQQVTSASVGVANVFDVSVVSASVLAGARADRPGVHADVTDQAYDSEVLVYFRDVHRPRHPSTTDYRRWVRLRRLPASTRVLTAGSCGSATAQSVDSFVSPVDSP